MRFKLKNIKVLLLSVLLFMFGGNVFSQATITVKGNWTKRVKDDKVSDAGNDFKNSLYSGSNRTRIRVRKTPTSSLFPWRVDVRQDNITWDSRLVLSVKRTDDGDPITSGGTISGGTTFQTLSNIDQSFFSGTGSRKNIHVQYRVSGVTVLLPAGVWYEATIVYTLTEL
jgi:hypothetical protein